MLRRRLYLIVLIIILLSLPSYLVARARDLGMETMGPLGHYFVTLSVKLHNQWENLHQIPQLRDDRAHLQEEVGTLQQQLANQAEIKRENEVLRQSLGVTGVTKDINKVLARIIIWGNDPLDRTFTIDVGSKQQIKIGQPAVFQGFLIGRVTAVQNNTAVVRALVSKNSQIQVRLVDSHELGLLSGDGSSAQLTDITQGVNVANGTLVETSGLGGTLSQGILLGEISSSLSKPSDLSQKFAVKLSEDYNTLDSLFILLTEAPQ